MSHGGVPVRADLQAAQEGPAEARDHLRRLIVRRQRVALHAAVLSIQPAGGLHEDPLVHLRGGARRGDPPPQRGKDISDVDRGGARRVADVINVYTRSNFGYAFHVLLAELPVRDRQQDDGVDPRRRSEQLQRSASAWCLRDIHNKAKNVVWMNPENPSAWGFGDSVMDKYTRPTPTSAEECRNLRQLSNLIDRLVL